MALDNSLNQYATPKFSSACKTSPAELVQKYQAVVAAARLLEAALLNVSPELEHYPDYRFTKAAFDNDACHERALFVREWAEMMVSHCQEHV